MLAGWRGGISGYMRRPERGERTGHTADTGY
jgi:hypothetical protein